MTLTMAKLLESMELVKQIERDTQRPIYPMPFNGVKVYSTPHALKDTDERLFPASKNRSARIRKKLIKRFGGEFRKEPCMWSANGAIYAHPVHYRELERQFKLSDQGKLDHA